MHARTAPAVDAIHREVRIFFRDGSASARVRPPQLAEKSAAMGAPRWPAPGRGCARPRWPRVRSAPADRAGTGSAWCRRNRSLDDARAPPCSTSASPRLAPSRASSGAPGGLSAATRSHRDLPIHGYHRISTPAAAVISSSPRKTRSIFPGTLSTNSPPPRGVACTDGPLEPARSIAPHPQRYALLRGPSATWPASTTSARPGAARSHQFRGLKQAEYADRDECCQHHFPSRMTRSIFPATRAGRAPGTPCTRTSSA